MLGIVSILGKRIKEVPWGGYDISYYVMHTVFSLIAHLDRYIRSIVQLQVHCSKSQAPRSDYNHRRMTNSIDSAS